MRKRSLLEIVMLSALAWVLSGCAANRLSLAPQQVSIHRQNSDKVEILRPDLYQADDGTWVSGVLKQQRPGTAAVRVHVDVHVLGPDGQLVYETAAGEILVPRDRLGKGLDWKRFRVHLPAMPPDGSQITMTVHPGPHCAEAAS